MKTLTRYLLLPSLLLFTFILTDFNLYSQNNNASFVVVLDAGHGGHDPGNLGNGYREKDIALNVTLMVGKALEKNKNIKVIYTRKTDVFVELRERANIANKAKADLFVSIHCNAHNSGAHGTETFVLGVANNDRNFEVAKKENQVIFLEDDYEGHYDGFNPNNPESTIGLAIIQEEYVDQSILLARLVEDNFSKKLKRNSRGIKQASLWVMHNTYMPSVLIELGFLTAKSEGAYLNSSNGQTEMSKAIENAIIDYKAALEQNVGVAISKPVTTNDNIAETKILIDKNIIFKVQIAASSKSLDIKPYNFKGLQNISKEKSGSLYKYYYSESSDYNQILKDKEMAHSKGYRSAFIVAFKDNVQITVEDALKSSAN